MTTVIGIIIIDHGSRRAESNAALEEIVQAYAVYTGRAIVEPAHMEFAAPTLTDAFDACVRRGATFIVVHPYFLLPGRHSQEDIPRMAAEAAARHTDVAYTVTEPLGLSNGILDTAEARIHAALQAAAF